MPEEGLNKQSCISAKRWKLTRECPEILEEFQKFRTPHHHTDHTDHTSLLVCSCQNQKAAKSCLRLICLGLQGTGRILHHNTCLARSRSTKDPCFMTGRQVASGALKSLSPHLGGLQSFVPGELTGGHQ